MRIAVEHRPPPPESHLLEVVPGRTGAAAITPAENLLAALSLRAPFALEIAATAERRRFLARAGSAATRQHLAGQLGVAYPQAELRFLDAGDGAPDDPARLQPGEQVAACALGLRAPIYLPLRTFSDLDVAADRAAQADPVLGILAALGDLPSGWRALSQLVLRPARDDWSRPYLRLAQEDPLARERAAERHDTDLGSVWRMVGLAVLCYVGLQGYEWYLDEDWLSLGLLGTGSLGGLVGLVWLTGRLGRVEVYDRQLVREKVGRIAYHAQLRLAVFAPARAPAAGLALRLGQVAAAYRQFNLAAGNGLEPRRLRPRGRDFRELRAFPSWRAAAPLNVRELAGLWHLPQGGAEAPDLERTAARSFLPLPETVAHGCRIGVSSALGRSVTVSLADDLLGRHMLLAAKTRRGKSSLLLRLARYLMEQDPRQAVVVVDPHRDLAEAALGLVPEHRRADVVHLDAGDRQRPFGLNLIDAELGWDAHQAVESTLTIFKQLWPTFWGPRMENSFRWALKALYDDNERICRLPDDGVTGGPQHQHTVLEVPHLLLLARFRHSVSQTSKDPFAKDWWSLYDTLPRQLQIESAHPVVTKILRFAASAATRDVIGQPRSTIDPASWIRDGKVVIVNTARGTIGEDTSALIGSTLINLVGLHAAAQAALPAGQRRRVTVIVDEFHALPGANYELLLSELAKYGLNVVLATQSLARLEMLDRRQERALRPLVFANIDGLFAFHVSAEDARYLVRELAGDDRRDEHRIDEADLVSLPDYACYARITVGGRRLPVFSVGLDPPPTPDAALRDELADESAARYGRDWQAVEKTIASALNGIRKVREQAEEDAAQAGKAGAGVARDAAAGSSGQSRSNNRRRRGSNGGKQGRGKQGQSGKKDRAGEGQDTPPPAPPQEASVPPEERPAPEPLSEPPLQRSFDFAARGSFPGAGGPSVPPDAAAAGDASGAGGEAEAAR